MLLAKSMFEARMEHYLPDFTGTRACSRLFDMLQPAVDIVWLPSSHGSVCDWNPLLSNQQDGHRCTEYEFVRGR